MVNLCQETTHQKIYPTFILIFTEAFLQYNTKAPEEVADDGGNASLPSMFEFRITLNLSESI